MKRLPLLRERLFCRRNSSCAAHAAAEWIEA
jgi:hypothetical protein